MPRSKITLEEWNSVLKKCINFINSSFSEEFPCSESLIAESLVCKFRKGERSEKLFQQLLKFSEQREDE